MKTTIICTKSWAEFEGNRAWKKAWKVNMTSQGQPFPHFSSSEKALWYRNSGLPVLLSSSSYLAYKGKQVPMASWENSKRERKANSPNSLSRSSGKKRGGGNVKTCTKRQWTRCLKLGRRSDNNNNRQTQARSKGRQWGNRSEICLHMKILRNSI